MKKVCETTTKSNTTDLVFVHKVARPSNETGTLSESAHMGKPAACLQRSMFADQTSCYLHYFFTCFLPSNNIFGGAVLVIDDLVTMTKSSSALRDTIGAVAMLHAQRQDHLVLPEQWGGTHSNVFLQYYARSVSSVQQEITSGLFVESRSALWTTFLLGIFEVRTCWCANYSQVSGSLWLKTNDETLDS